MRCGDKTVQHSFEVVPLPEDSPILLENDIFSSFRISIIRILVDYPDRQIQPLVIKAEEPDPIISSDLSNDEQDIEFKQRREDFLQ